MMRIGMLKTLKTPRKANKYLELFFLFTRAPFQPICAKGRCDFVEEDAEREKTSVQQGAAY